MENIDNEYFIVCLFSNLKIHFKIDSNIYLKLIKGTLSKFSIWK